MRLFKIKCPDLKNARSGTCHLYSGIVIFGLNTVGMPPHNADCKCYAKELDDKESELFFQKLKES